MENLASQYTVLVVDDVPTNVMLVQAILKKEGYTLLTTDSGAKALRIAQERHPNLILLDIMMPEMDGYESLLLSNTLHYFLQSYPYVSEFCYLCAPLHEL